MWFHARHPKAPKSKPVAEDSMQTLPLAEVEKELGSSPAGLTEAEAQKRLTQYGPNEIEEKKTTWLEPLSRRMSERRIARASLHARGPVDCSYPDHGGRGRAVFARPVRHRSRCALDRSQSG